jgi:DNA-binding transcriptional ArsR family regulator
VRLDRLEGFTELDRLTKLSSFQLSTPQPSEKSGPVGSPSSETTSESAALLTELRATFERLLSSLGTQQAERRPALPLEEPQDQPSPNEGLGAAGLKRLLQLRGRRRRKPTGEFFDWPAWDMLLDLAAVRAEGGHVSVSSVCISSGAPQSTALRKLAALENAKLVRRYFHGPDRRRVCIALTDEAAEMVASAIREEATFYRTIAAPR